MNEEPKPTYASTIVKRRGGPLKPGYYLFHKEFVPSTHSWPVSGPHRFKIGAHLEGMFRRGSYNVKWWSLAEVPVLMAEQ